MSHERQDQDALERALGDWKSAKVADESFSGDCRDRILRESLRAELAVPALARLFLPVRQWVVGATVPVALAAVLGAGFWFGAGVPEPGYLGSRVASVEVQRQGGEVVFIIDNGGIPHRVMRSTDPRGANGSPLEGRGREFRDRLDAGPAIVYYRID